MKTTLILYALLLLSITTTAQSFQWAAGVGSTSNDRGYSIAVDGSGNVFTTGIFKETVDFDPGADTFNLTSAGDDDIFISKLDAAGNFVWAKALGGTSTDTGNTIAVDGSGNVYTTGSFEGTADFDPGADTFNLTSTGEVDIFISKLDAAGNFVWAKKMGGTSYDVGNSIVVDGSGNVFTTGYFSETVDFDFGTDTFNLTSAGYNDIFISKLDTAGNFTWAIAMGGTNFDSGLSIAVDGSGNVFTTGYFQVTGDFDPGADTFNLTSAGQYDIFISKLDAAGNFTWAKKMGGTAYDVAYSIAVDGNGNVFNIGYFKETGDFNPGADTFNLTSLGNSDIIISKLDAAGNFTWAKAMGGTGYDSGYSITVDDNGNVFTTGDFEGTADFNPGEGIFNLTSAGGRDIFISKLDAAGNFAWAKNMGGTDSDFSYSIAVDGNGNMFTTGEFQGTADFDPGAGTFNLTSAGSRDIFISKFDGGVVGVNEWSDVESFSVAPNPTNGMFEVRSEKLEVRSIEIYNVLGEMLLDLPINQSTNQLINLSSHPNGIYFISIKTPHGTANKKIILNK